MRTPSRRGTRPRTLLVEPLEARVVMDATFRWANPISAASAISAVARAGAVAVAGDGSVYVAGSGRDTLTFGAAAGSPSVAGTTAGFDSAYLARYSAAGNLLFAKAMPAAGLGGFASVASMTIDAAGNLYVGAKTKDAQAAVVKLDSAGNALWSAVIPSVSTISTVNDLSIDPTSGAIVAVGTFIGQNVDFDPGAGVKALSSTSAFGDAFVAKYTPAGSLEWAIPTRGLSSNSVVGNAVAVDAIGQIYVAGAFNGAVDFDPSANVRRLQSASALDPFLLYLSGAGDLVWSRVLQGQVIAGASQRVSEATGLAVEGQSVYVSGTLTGMAIVDINARTGTPVTATGGANGSAFVAKYASTSAFQWAKVATGGPSRGEQIVADGTGVIVLAGTYTNLIEFNPAPNQVIATVRGEDSFLARLDGNGTVIGFNGVLSGNDPNSEFAEGTVALTAVAMHPTTGDLVIVGGYSGSSAAPSGAVRPASQFGDILLPELALQGGQAVGATGNVFVATIAPLAFVPTFANVPFILPEDNTGPKTDDTTFTLQPRITGIITPGSTVDLLNATTGLPLATATAAANGQYILPTPLVTIGSTSYLVRIRDGGQLYPFVPIRVVIGFDPGSGLGNGGGGGGGTPSPNPGEPSTPVGPVVREAKIVSIRARPRGPVRRTIQVAFTGQFQAAAVLNLGNYTLQSAGKDRRFNTRDDRAVPMRTIAFDATSRGVTLTPRAKLAVNLPLRLTITGLAGGVPTVAFLGPKARNA